MKTAILLLALLCVAAYKDAGSQSAGWPDRLEELFVLGPQDLGFDAQRAGQPSLIFLPVDDRLITLGGSTGRVDSWNSWSGESISSYDPFGSMPDESHYRLWAVSPGGGLLAMGMAYERMAIVEYMSGSLLEIFNVIGEGEYGQIEGASFSPDGHYLATGSSSGRSLKLWNLRSGQLSTSIPGEILDLQFHPTDGTIAFSRYFESGWGVEIWSGDLSRIIHSFEAYRPLAFSPDGRLLAARSPTQDSDVIVRRTSDWSQTVVLPGQSTWILDIDLSPDGRFAVTLESDGIARIWDVDRGEVAREIGKRSGVFHQVRFSPDGSRIALASDDEVVVWGDRNFGVGKPKVSVTASSTLPQDQPGVSYAPESVLDGNKQTAWNEGVPGLGVGESITMTFDKELYIDTIQIFPGFFDARWWKNNGRPKLLDVRTDSAAFSLPLKNEMKPQRFYFKTPLRLEQISFTLAEVYPGLMYEDTCISEIAFFYRGEKLALEPMAGDGP